MTGTHPTPAAHARTRPPRRLLVRAPGARPLLAVLSAAAVAAGLLVAVTAPVAQAAGPVAVGAGSYTTDRVGAVPGGCGDLADNPRTFLTPDAPAGPVPTNDWWSTLAYKRLSCAFSEPLHAHPASYLPGPTGLGISYTQDAVVSGSPTGLQEYHFPYGEDLVAGVAGLQAPDVRVADWSDWTVTPAWSDGTRTLRATIGHGLPFSSYQVTGGDARITASGEPEVWLRDGARIGLRVGGSDYVAWAPSGSTWTQSGTAFTAALGNVGRYSVAVLPTSVGTPVAERISLADSFGRYAYSAVTGSTVSYDYDPASARVQVRYGLQTQAWQGSTTGTVAALYPHQAQKLTGAAPVPQEYVSPRGPMPVLVGTAGFTTVDTFRGVLPEVPAVATASGADLDRLRTLLAAERSDPMKNDGKLDTYWQGKGLGRAARLAEIADQVGDTQTRDAALGAIRSTLTEWFTATPGKTERVFGYDQGWGTLIGYPASYGSDQELNDHHFHYGYFVAAAATLARFDPQWASDERYGGMVDLLIRDANSYDRSETRFPYLRDFDIYAGHDWASGHGAFGAGNNQESSSEGMNFANALIQWGQATGDTAVRDAGVYLYTTQAAAIQNYWYDSSGEAFPDGFGHPTVGIVWGDGGAYATWFSAEPEKIQGINMLPVTGGHLYLGYRPDLVRENYDHLVRTGGQPAEWKDVLWSFLALGDGDRALAALQADPGYAVEEGESRAHTWHWIRNLAALGTVDTSVSADHPLASVFTEDGQRTYVAANTGPSALTVRFSDGLTLAVPAGSTATTGRYTWSGGGAPGGVTPTDPPTDPPTSSTLHLVSGGALSSDPGAAGRVTLPSAEGVNRDGTPHAPAVFTARGLTGRHDGGSTAFSVGVDAGTAVGLATQLRVSYDRTGDGTWDRVETYRYLATDPVPGDETYSQASGLVSSSGTMGDLAGGTVRVEVWSVLGSGTPTVTTGPSAVVRLPLG